MWDGVGCGEHDSRHLYLFSLPTITLHSGTPQEKPLRRTQARKKKIKDGRLSRGREEESHPDWPAA